MKNNFSNSYEVCVECSDTKPSNLSINIRVDHHKLSLHLPKINGIRYQFLPHRRHNLFKVESEEARTRALPQTQAAYRRFMNRFFYKQHRKLAFDDFLLAVDGPYPARRFFHQFVKHLRNEYGHFDIRYLTVKEIFSGWTRERSAAAPARPQAPNTARAVIVCHMYYMEVLEEIAALIASRRQQIDVIITIPLQHESWRDRIIQMIPGARVIAHENMGRDVRPFLKVLEDGHLDAYEVICKIHGKLSRGGGRAQFFGDIWRRRSFYDLLGNQDALDRTLDLFARDPSVGMIGPAAYRCPGPIFNEATGWGTNRDRVLELAARMGIAPSDLRLDFFAGTMFWVRRDALRPLRHLALADSFFDQESGLLDGGPEHAVERIFGTSVVAAGMRLLDA